MKKKSKREKPVLIGMFGYPGSGKTYFCERLAKEKDWVHVSSDRIRPQMFKNPTYERWEHNAVSDFMSYLSDEFLKRGISVIRDSNLNFRKNRQSLKKSAEKLGAEFRLVWIQTPEELALERLRKYRNPKKKAKKGIYPGISEAVFYELKAEMQPPTKHESVIAIDGKLSFKKQLTKFEEQL